MSNLLQTELWIWMHLLMCNVSNQARSKEEDAINRPWRPLPSDRVTESQAIVLRWAVAGICVIWSTLYGRDQVLTSLGLLLTTFMYDEAGLSKHVIGKNFCNIGGYAAFEIGATKIIAASRHLDSVSVHAVIISGILIFTTIQAQDFPDVEGDAAMGRVTFPIYAPEFSRIATLAVMVAWSIFLGFYWSLGAICSLALVVLGFYSGLRYYLWRQVAQDRKSYLVFSVSVARTSLHKN
ncbi:UbiA prenyltransferase family [Mycena pura]|uniref:UbiA prenyltransferase family n=1 Tax=Mycena pura TaxID=153505 RepID=A0AAD6YLN6_9AGAR|nr:UbiA prenyltransferase family [Mycena pura]